MTATEAANYFPWYTSMEKTMISYLYEGECYLTQQMGLHVEHNGGIDFLYRLQTTGSLSQRRLRELGLFALRRDD